MKVYCASGWFNERDDKILTKMEDLIRNIPGVEPYFPRRDGIILKPDASLADRQRTFEDNVKHIDEADCLIANLDCGSPRLDTGTVWEVARAVTRGTPVFAYTNYTELFDRLYSLVRTLSPFSHIGDVSDFLDYFSSHPKDLLRTTPLSKRISRNLADKVVYFDSRDADDEVLAILSDNLGENLRIVSNLDTANLPDVFSEIFNNAKCIVVATDKKNPVVTWFMGMAYALDIPIITYTETGADMNVMLLHSIRYHVKGPQKLRDVASILSRSGVDSLPVFRSQDYGVH